MLDQPRDRGEPRGRDTAKCRGVPKRGGGGSSQSRAYPRGRPAQRLVDYEGVDQIKQGCTQMGGGAQIGA